MNKKERPQQLHHHFYLHKGVQNLKLECDDETPNCFIMRFIF
jgi:hypothetical protein